MNTEEILGLPSALPDGVSYDDYLIATYLANLPAAMPAPLLSMALAVEQSTGTWVPVPGETPELRREHIAKVIGVYAVPDYEFEVPKGVDTRFPKKYVAAFKGPKFGIDGIRKLLNIPKRPLLNNMIKPCTGYPLELGAELFRQAALGGCDIIKDDELIADASFNSMLGRVKRYMEIEKQVFEEKGEHTLYTVNITDRVPKVLENAKRAVELGVNALMVNYLAVGIDVMRAITEDPAINVPVLGHMDVAGAMYMSPLDGLSSHLVLGKLPRLAGADIVVIPAPYGKAPVLVDKFQNVAKNLTYPLYHLKPTFPMPSGGITQPMLPKLMQELGNDIVIGSGGGIHAHPQGPVAGGKAFRQAIDATMKGIPLKEYAKDHPELDAVMKMWADPFGKGN